MSSYFEHFDWNRTCDSDGLESSRVLIISLAFWGLVGEARKEFGILGFK